MINSGSARQEIAAGYRKLHSEEIHRSCSTHTKFCKENLNGRDHTGNLDTDSE
jgi:hypothetical protein